MAKIHITLVGGQPAPVYKGIIDEQPDKVVLVCSSDSVELADNVQEYASEKIEGLQCEQVLMSPVSIPEIRKKIDEINSSLSGDDAVTVNLSGGTKVWSILFYDFFKDKAECIFIDQNDNKYNFITGQTTKINVRLGITESLWLNNIKITGMHLLTEYDEEDFEAVQAVRKMRKFSTANFNRLMQQVEDNPGDTDWCIDKWNYLSYYKEKNTCSLSLSTKRGLKEEEICCPHIHKVMFNTGWFELEVAKLLGEWVQPQQVAMNCELRSSKSEDSPTLNEIDIIVKVRGKLLFVECKTQVKDARDVDKFNNAIRSYGGLSAKGIFFTDAVMKAQAKVKCNNAGILTFSMQEIMKAGGEGKKKLFKELSEHISGLNIR